MKYKLFIVIIVLLLINCSKDTSAESPEDLFEKAVNNYSSCQTKYEIKYDKKPIIDVRNGTDVIGLAKDVSDYLRKNCYNTYYENWNFKTSDNKKGTYIIIDNITESSLVMIEELKIALDFDFDVTIKYPECTNMKISNCIEDYPITDSDIILIIGRDYQKNEVK
mgnify:CR=1 FL=1